MADRLTIPIAAFAVWRVTHPLAREDGPWQCVARLHGALAQSWAGHLMDCVKCLSLWVALPFAFAIDAGWATLAGPLRRRDPARRTDHDATLYRGESKWHVAVI